MTINGARAGKGWDQGEVLTCGIKKFTKTESRSQENRTTTKAGPKMSSCLRTKAGDTRVTWGMAALIVTSVSVCCLFEMGGIPFFVAHTLLMCFLLRPWGEARYCHDL